MLFAHALALARAFARHPAVMAGRFHRMQALIESGEGGDLYRDAGLANLAPARTADAGAPPRPGASSGGLLAALPFGQTDAQALHRLADHLDGTGIVPRLTPLARALASRRRPRPGKDARRDRFHH